MPTYKNLAGFSPEKIELLEKDFAGLNESGSDLAQRAVRYVVDGEDNGVVDALKKAHKPAEQLRLFGTKQKSSTRVDFFATVDTAACDGYLRLAKVYEAAAKSGPLLKSVFPASDPPWLAIFLREATRGKGEVWSGEYEQFTVPFELLEGMLAADGRDSTLLTKVLFSVEPVNFLGVLPVTTLTSLPGFRGSVLKHGGVVADALSRAGASRKVEFLKILSEHEIAPEPFVHELVALATSTAKTVREAAAPLLERVRDGARPLIEQVAVNGTPTERAFAVRWLGRFGGGATRSFLFERQQAEKGVKIQEAIGDALSELGQNPTTQTAVTPGALPPLSPIEAPAPLNRSARQAVAELIETYNKAAEERNKQLAQHRRKHPIYDQSRIDATCRLLESLTDAPHLDGESALPLLWGAAMQESLANIAEHPDIRLIHLLRLMALTGQITARQRARPTMAWWCEECLRRHRANHPPGFTLRELAATLEAIGLDSRMIGYDVLSGYSRQFQWLAGEFPEYFAKHVDLLQAGLDNQPLAGRLDFEWREVRAKTLRVLSQFSNLPPALVPLVWHIAVGSAKTDRAAAQAIMQRVPDLRQRLADALASGDYQTRVVAAEWLGRSGDKQAAGLLHKALAKEKQDAAKDAMLTALERLGESIERYLDREQLLAEAERGLKKGLHKDLGWFPVNSWPEVRWHDTRTAVPREILNWFLAQTYKLGSPEAGALLRRYCQQVAPDDREALGRFVLTTWLEYDGRPKYTEAEARQRAKQEAVKSHQMMQGMAKQYPQILQLTLAHWEEQHYETFASQRSSTAIKSKGILALAAACCGDEAVKIVGDYLKQWYGYRAAQCRALVAMLASLDRPPAIQLLLSVANRFRTKSIREEAEKYVRLVAERKGWTIDELADRTVPTAGFDDSLTLELDYGPRQLTARLRPDFSIELTDENGKTLKSLPEPRKDDDSDKAKAAKKQLSTAKSELKKLVAQQTARLYEAMCTERVWNHADWHAYLQQHPIVGRLCQRLVWALLDGDKITHAFRPLDDGTLTDEHDEQVVLGSDARLRLVHGSLLSPETSGAWTRHLADYEVEPLFSQFGRDRYQLADDKKDATEVSDFVGYLIEAFKLRGYATRLGYTRGPAQDGGWFYEYEKTLAGMGLKVVLRFSGNGMPEENRTVALMDLHFSPTGGESGGMSFDQPGVPLRDVPGVLLSECHHDLKTIAGAGTGYDADWRKRAGM